MAGVGLWCNHDGCRNISSMETTYLKSAINHLQGEMAHLQRLFNKDEMNQADLDLLIGSASRKLDELQTEFNARDDE